MPKSYLDAWARGLAPRKHRALLDALLANLPASGGKRRRSSKRAFSPRRSSRSSRSSRSRRRASRTPAAPSTE